MDFIPSLPTLIAFTIAILVLAVTPGPDMTLWISRSLREGRKAGFMTLVGTNLGITAEVKDYNADQCLFHLKPVETSFR